MFAHLVCASGILKRTSQLTKETFMNQHNVCLRNAGKSMEDLPRFGGH